jgi:lipoyl(octanoyl) transferase
LIEIQDWGLIDYHSAWERQKEIVKDIQNNRNRNVFVLCEHPSVITIGKNGTSDNVIAGKSILESNRIDVVYNDRGGDVTLHNPGQLVGYPIFNLQNYKTDLHWFLREIEDSIIELLKLYNINSHTINGLTGVWVDNQRKICAMGLHCSKWVTSHGFALNAVNNLAEFNFIIPCGITDKQVTSISSETGTNIDFDKLKCECIKVFENRF